MTRAPGTSPTSDASVVDEVAGQQLVVAFNRWVGDLERSPDDLSALTERLCRLLDIAGLPDHGAGGVSWSWFGVSDPHSDGPTPDGAVSQTVSDVLWQRHTVDLYAMLLQAAFPLGQAPPRSEEALGRLRSRLPLQLQFEALLQLIGAVNNPATPLPRGTVGTEADRASRAHYEARIGEALTWLLLRPNGVLALLATLLVGVEPGAPCSRSCCCLIRETTQQITWPWSSTPCASSCRCRASSRPPTTLPELRRRSRGCSASPARPRPWCAPPSCSWDASPNRSRRASLWTPGGHFGGGARMPSARVWRVLFFSRVLTPVQGRPERVGAGLRQGGADPAARAARGAHADQGGAAGRAPGGRSAGRLGVAL